MEEMEELKKLVIFNSEEYTMNNLKNAGCTLERPTAEGGNYSIVRDDKTLSQGKTPMCAWRNLIKSLTPDGLYY